MNTEMLIVKYIDILSASMRQSMRDYKEASQCEALFKLTITQLHYLHAIKETEAVTFRALAEKFAVQKSTVTDIVNRLIKRNLVEKYQSTEDLRVFHLHLTDQGRHLLAVEEEGYYRFAQKMTVCMQEDEKKQFTNILAKIIAELQIRRAARS